MYRQARHGDLALALYRYAGYRLRRMSSAAVLPWLGLPAGTIVVTCAYACAANSIGGDLPYHLFWLGMLLFTVPALWRLCAYGTSRAEQAALLVAMGLFDYLPKFLRDPQYPLFHDELAHWRQTETIYATGVLGPPNPLINIVQYFPGLHALAVALRDLSGLSTVQVATVLLPLLHACALLGMYALARQVIGSTAAALAAAIYSLNPGYMFFDTQFSYESPAIVFAIWALVMAAHLQQAGRWTQRIAPFTIGLVLAGACIVTHHLSSYVLAGILLVVTAFTVLQAARRRLAASASLHTQAGTRHLTNGTARSSPGGAQVLSIACFTLLVTGGALAWLIFVAPGVIAYLSPALHGSTTAIAHLFGHGTHTRTLFALSTLPAYERICAFLSPPIALLGALAGLRLFVKSRRRSPLLWALALLGLLYFPSLPFILTQSGNEGARRSWSFSYIGLCILVAPALLLLLRRRTRRRQHAARLAVIALLCIVMIGNVAMHVNETYRFPGPFIYGSDTRSLTPNLLATARWFSATQGTGLPVVADRYSSLPFAAFGHEWTAPPSKGFPIWQLYLQAHPPDPLLLHELEVSGYRYLIVDTRLAHNLPRIGIYVSPDEPGAFTRPTPPPPSILVRYEHLPWADKIYQSDTLNIYRLDFTALRASSAGRPVRP